MIQCKTIDGRVVKLHPIDYREQLAKGHIAEGPNLTITAPPKKTEKSHTVVVKPSTKPEDIPDVTVHPTGDIAILSPGEMPASDKADQSDNTVISESSPVKTEEKLHTTPIVEKKKRVIQRVGKRKKSA